MGVFSRPFNAEIDAVVLLFAVPVVFAIGFVMLDSVSHQIGQGKPVMGGDEVDALERRVAVMLIEIGASGQPRGE